jgi:hypothetical protein
MIVAVLFSPGAGGRNAFPRVGEILDSALAGCRILTCPGDLGSSFLPGAMAIDLDSGLPYVALMREAAGRLARGKPDLFVCVGGDGLASYVADALIAQRAMDPSAKDIPILGVGAGTANVGPIVSIPANNLERLDLHALSKVRVGAVEAKVGGKHLAYGFNDIVLGNTFLGTVGGVAQCLSAFAMASAGRHEPAQPEPTVAGAGFRVEKNGKAVAGASLRPAQIIASPLFAGEFHGRAVAGVLCEAAYTPGLAALSLLGSALVRPDSAEECYANFLRVDQLLFKPGDHITLDGLAETAEVVADGNPFLRHGLPVVLEYVPDLITVAKV